MQALRLERKICASQMINTYRRTARTHAELNLGELAFVPGRAATLLQLIHIVDSP
jgi:hypothetical protein